MNCRTDIQTNNELTVSITCTTIQEPTIEATSEITECYSLNRSNDHPKGSGKFYNDPPSQTADSDGEIGRMKQTNR